MNFPWKSFPICLRSFNELLKSNNLPTDGIVADNLGFTVVEVQPLTQQQQDLVLSFYNSLNELEESNKISRMTNLDLAKLLFRESLVYKSWDSMTPLERKVAIRSRLSVAEEDEILAWWVQNG